MNIVYFTHSLASCWNHGNAHFVRGVLRELAALGHAVTACEPADGWSRTNLVADHGAGPFERIHRLFPEIAIELYDGPTDVDRLVDGADLVIVHEWTEPAVVAAVGARRKLGGQFQLLFHDTHHRIVSDPDEIAAFDLSGYDGILAFGEALAEVYRRQGWSQRTFVWHEAADIRLFRPPESEGERHGLVWIGNWGDDERTAELARYLLGPAHDLAVPLDVYGVRYPPDALAALGGHGARHHGWLANVEVPAVFARHLATVHVPRRFYVENLPGIPTIRMFEAMACGIPLLCAPWEDSEKLFAPGSYLTARDGRQMRAHLRDVLHDAGLRRELARTGLETVRARHTCAHRAAELLAIARHLAQPERGVA
jgi:spore maturation protein CgeB